MRCANRRQKVGHARSALEAQPCCSPEGKVRQETNDVKHRPRAATPVRHLGAAGSDGIMRGPQAMTERASEVVNHIKVELVLFGQSHR